MKRLLLVVTSSFTFFSYGQVIKRSNKNGQDNSVKGTYEQRAMPRIGGGIMDVAPNVNCTPRAQPDPCANLILNNNFVPIPAYDPNNINIWADPFTTAPLGVGYVPNWEAAQGDPNIDDLTSIFFHSTVTSPPSVATGYAHMIGGNHTLMGLYHEGIAQKIAQLIPGHKYVLSFFELYSIGNVTNTTLDFNIVLMNCSDFSSIYPQPNPYVPPPIPVNSQTVYCETNVSIANWQQKIISFTATSAYDMIWIFPKAHSGPFYPSAIDFALPELKDVTGFTAGSNPTPTPGNCIVTIGPATPNSCTVVNAEFKWRNPQGVLIAASPNQQMSVDASDPNNVGTWTLIMTAPGVTNTNNSCSQPLSASVVVPGCAVIWPKVYEAAEINDLKIDNAGNIFTYCLFNNMANNINHNGVLSNLYVDYYVHYDKTSGATNWINAHEYFNFSLSSTDLNFVTGNGNVYRNGAFGTVVSGPASVLSGDHILAEDNGVFIVQDGYNIRVRPTGTLPISIPTIPGYNLEVPIRRAIYDPVTHNLYISLNYSNGNSGLLKLLGVYHLDPVTNILSSLNTPVNNPIGTLLQANTNGEIIVLNGGVLAKYDYGNFSNTNIAIVNFVNSSLEEVRTSNQVVENRVLVKSPGQQVFYCVNTIGFPTALKISYTVPSNTIQFYNYYVFDGNDVFIAGEYSGTGFTIGNQGLPLLGSGSSFITKFNIQNDFTSKQSSKDFVSNISNGNSVQSPQLVNKTDVGLSTSSFTIALSPNPARNILQVNIDQKQGIDKSGAVYRIVITSATGVTVRTKTTNKSVVDLNISQLTTGIYHVTVIDSKGVKIDRSFIKN